MNLQVNLILESEKRSGSTISLKFVIRVVAVVVPLVLGMAIVILVLGARSARQNTRFVEQEKRQIDPVYKSVIALKQELRESQQLMNLLNGWSASRIDWYALLRGLQSVVPASVQLMRLTVNETVEPVENTPARTAGMYMKGKVIGEHGEEDVQLFDRALKEKPPFNSLLERVEVKRFAASENITERNVRVFDIECRLVPKKIGKLKLASTEKEKAEPEKAGKEQIKEGQK